MIYKPSYTTLSQSDISIQIERLVKAIETSDRPAYEIIQSRSGYERVQPTRLTRYFACIQQMIDLFEDRDAYRYSEHLEAFRRACQDIGLERSPSGPVCLNEQDTAYLDHPRSMNVLVARIRQLTREPWYRRRKDDRGYQARQQECRVVDYDDAVLDRYARAVVVRVDLYYSQAAQVRLRVEHVFDDMNRLISERERNPIFAHEISFICRVEQGEDRGYHIHAAFFFNGAEVRSDIYKAVQIGELWERITRGQGCFNSCNHDKKKYGERLGIGLIRRGDLKSRSHVHKAMQYLVKDDQQLRLKPVGAKCLRKGQIR